MNEVEKVEYLKAGKKLVDNGCISDDEFTALKNDLISLNKTPQTPLSELERIKIKEKAGVINSEEYNSIKRDFLAGKKVVDADRIAQLHSFRNLLNRNIINEEDFSAIKKDVLDANSRRDIQKLEKQLENVESYRKLVTDEILTESQYNRFKQVALSGKVISPDHGFNILYEYQKLLKDNIISEDDFETVRTKLLQGKHPSSMDDTAYLRQLHRYYKDELINQEDFQNNKNAFIHGKKHISPMELGRLAGYKKLVKEEIITEEEYDSIKGSILKSMPVKNADEIKTIKEYKDLKEQGVITQEDYDNYKKNLLPKPIVEIEKEAKERKAKNKKTIIIASVIGALVVAALVVGLVIVPEMQAKKAYEEYLSGYDTQIDSAYYHVAVDEANALLEKYNGILDEDETATLNSRIAYANALKELDFTDSNPDSRIEIYTAKSNLEGSDGYGISDQLLQFMDKNGDVFDDNIYGTLKIDHSKYKEKKSDNDANAEGTAFQMGDSDLNLQSGSETVNFEDSLKPVDSGRYRSGGSVKAKWDPDVVGTDDKEEEEEKPVINEYDVEGFVTFGFRKKDKNKPLNASNTEIVAVLHAGLSDTPEEKDICTSYDAVFEAKEGSEFVVNGSGATAVEGKTSWKDSTVSVDFGNGITLEMTTSRPASDYSGSSSSGGSSSYNKKDYSEDSDWKNYDHDSDGKINDKEFQDATNDYMDDYFGGDSSGTDLNDYDYNGNGNMETKEFQDAVGDYMDQNGY